MPYPMSRVGQTNKQDLVCALQALRDQQERKTRTISRQSVTTGEAAERLRAQAVSGGQGTSREWPL